MLLPRPAPSRTASRVAALALLLAAAGCAREVEVTVVVDGTPLLDKASADASPTGLAEMGKRLRVKVPRFSTFGTHAYWAVKDSKAFVRADDVAPYPVAGTPGFATSAKLEIRGANGEAVKELAMGAPVHTIAPPAVAEKKRLAVVENGVVIGFCDASAVSAEKPPLNVFRNAVREYLRQGDLEDARRFLDGGLGAYPHEPTLEPWVELLRRATEDPTSFLPPGQKANVPPDPPARKGADAWVAPLAAAVFEAPRADGRIVTVVRQNTKLDVLDTAGAFARIELAPSDAVAWAPVEGELAKLPGKLPEKYRAPAAADVAAPAPAKALYMRLADLQGAPSTAEKLVARGKAALAAAQAQESAKKADEGIELLSRAVGLGDPDGGAFEPLFDAAVGAGDLERAAWAMAVVKLHAPILHALRGANGWADAKIVDVALVRGCRAPILAGGALESVEMFSKLARPRPGQCLVVTGAEEPCEDCELSAEEASARLDRATAASEKFLSTADELYPLGPYLRITVANTGPIAGPPREPLFVHVPLGAGKTYWIPVLALGAYERVTLYVTVPADRDLYGVSLGEQAAEPPEEDDASTPLTAEAPEGTAWVGFVERCATCERNEPDDVEENHSGESGGEEDQGD